MKFNEKTKEILLKSLAHENKTGVAIESLLPDEVLDYICGALEDPTSLADDDLLELRDIIAPHLLDVGLIASDAAALEWLRVTVGLLVETGIVTRASLNQTLLDAPVELASDAGDERNLFIDRDDRAGLVDQEQLAAASEKYLKRKLLRAEKQGRLDEKKRAASLDALRSLQDEQQKGVQKRAPRNELD